MQGLTIKKPAAVSADTSSTSSVMGSHRKGSEAPTPVVPGDLVSVGSSALGSPRVARVIQATNNALEKEGFAPVTPAADM